MLKVTLPGYYGRTMDEDVLFDSRTFLNVSKLKLRDALPAEYLARWALLDHVFGLETEFEGIVRLGNAEPRMAISQAFIGVGQTVPELEDVEALMMAMGFEKVDAKLIANPENQYCTWYRQRDGILITDAFPRNFRKDGATGAVMPVDLMVNVVPPGGSVLLADAIEPFILPLVPPSA
ncbi:hypothetical protein FEM03_14975 [Phragmitibacter flavus]|uniref:Uncharacterized protein n=1 Tax=Phragmitibacter flavus TaxID=2576071 RepID=A0A5R8KEL5_9BACT|nr:hypothetical protein FEM03_14975 [Phragmitibacter flavus]